MNFKTITNESCCQGNRRIVLDEKISVKIGEGASFSIPTGAIANGTRLKLFVGFEHTCPMELNVALNGNPCADAGFGMDAYCYQKDPTLKPYTYATYSTTAVNPGKDAQSVTVTGNPDGIITYLELKIAE